MPDPPPARLNDSDVPLEIEVQATLTRHKGTGVQWGVADLSGVKVTMRMARRGLSFRGRKKGGMGGCHDMLRCACRLHHQPKL